MTMQKDSGFSWLMCAAAFGTYVSVTSVWHSFAILYAELVAYFDASFASVAMIQSVSFSVCSILGIVVGPLIARFGCRKVCMAGSFLTFLACSISSQLNSVLTLTLVYGLLGGIGCAGMFSAPAIIVQQHFDKYRAMAGAIAFCGPSMAPVMVAPLTRYLVDRFTWRGAILMIGAISLHGMVFGALFKPFPTKPSKAQKKPANFCSKICNFKLVLNPIFLIFGFAMLLAQFATNVAYGHIVNFALWRGVDKETAALVPPLMATTNTACRLLSGLVATKGLWDRKQQFAVAVFATGLSLHAMRFAYSMLAICLLGSVVFGLLGLWLALYHTVLTDMMGLAVVAQAISAMSVFFGSTALVAQPLAGLLFDVTQDYTVPFHVAGGLCSLGGLMYIALVFWARNRPLPSAVVSENSIKKLNDGEKDDVNIEDVESESKAHKSDSEPLTSNGLKV